MGTQAYRYTVSHMNVMLLYKRITKMYMYFICGRPCSIISLLPIFFKISILTNKVVALLFPPPWTLSLALSSTNLFQSFLPTLSSCHILIQPQHQCSAPRYHACDECIQIIHAWLLLVLSALIYLQNVRSSYSLKIETMFLCKAPFFDSQQK